MTGIKQVKFPDTIQITQGVLIPAGCDTFYSKIEKALLAGLREGYLGHLVLTHSPAQQQGQIRTQRLNTIKPSTKTNTNSPTHNGGEQAS